MNQLDCVCDLGCQVSAESLPFSHLEDETRQGLARCRMLFSRAANSSRMAQLGRMRGKDEQQLELRARLKFHAAAGNDEGRP